MLKLIGLFIRSGSVRTECLHVPHSWTKVFSDGGCSVWMMSLDTTQPLLKDSYW